MVHHQRLPMTGSRGLGSRAIAQSVDGPRERKQPHRDRRIPECSRARLATRDGMSFMRRNRMTASFQNPSGEAMLR